MNQAMQAQEFTESHRAQPEHRLPPGLVSGAQVEPSRGGFMQDLEYLSMELYSYRQWSLPNSPVLSITCLAHSNRNTRLFSIPRTDHAFPSQASCVLFPGTPTLPSSPSPNVSISHLADYSSQANSSLRPQLQCLFI